MIKNLWMCFAAWCMCNRCCSFPQIVYPYSPHKAEGYALFLVSHIVMHSDLQALLYENYCTYHAGGRPRPTAGKWCLLWPHWTCREPSQSTVDHQQVSLHAPNVHSIVYYNIYTHAVYVIMPITTCILPMQPVCGDQIQRLPWPMGWWLAGDIQRDV